MVEDLTNPAATAHGTPPPQAVHSPQSTAAIHNAPAAAEDNGDATLHTTAHFHCMPTDLLTPNQLQMRDSILLQMQDTERVRLPALKSIQKRQVQDAIRDANAVLQTIQSSSIGETNQLIYSTAVVVTEALGFRVKRVNRCNTAQRSPPWKTRLEGRIKKWRADISCLEQMKRGLLKNKSTKARLMKQYGIGTKTISEVSEELKQRVTATAKKIERYEARVAQFRQNRQFQTNQRRFYADLDGQSTQDAKLPDEQETVEFWSGIWDNPKAHNVNAEWIKTAEAELSGQTMNEVSITVALLKKHVKKVKNWTAPGPDQVHGYWLKNLSALHERLADQMDHLLQNGKIEDWLATGRTTLLMKDQQRGATPSNYRPITCLPTTYKLMTRIIACEMQDYLENHGLIPDEQKGNRRNTRGTKDQLLIDKMILKNAKRRHTNLSVAWIDYKKAFDSVPHSWISKVLDMLGINNSIRKFLHVAMGSWKTLITVMGHVMGQVNIRRGLFQGDSLSPLIFITALIPLTILLRKTGLGYHTSKTARAISHLLFMDDLKLYGKSTKETESLLNTVRIFSQDIAMEFGLDKCATLYIYRGTVQATQGIEMPNSTTIKGLSLEEGYKYLGILQSGEVKHSHVKQKTSSEYLRRVRKLLKSKLNGGNTIKGINSWAVPVIRYTAGIVDWTLAELDELDRKTRKLMTANHALHPQSDVDRLYLPRSEGGRGLQQIRQTVEEEKRSLSEYVSSRKEAALQEVKQEGLLIDGTKREFRRQELQSRRQRWSSKPLHGQYLKNIEGKVDETLTWAWLKHGELKKETEGFIMAAQDQALRTNAIKCKIDKTSNSSMCRLCGDREETVDHLVSSCSKIAQTDYKERHNKVAAMLHWNLCKKYGLPVTDKWWEHKAEKVVQTAEVKILWDFKIQTDKHLAHNIPDITVVEKAQTYLIDVAIPGDGRIDQKEQEKIQKYQDLKVEVERLWERKANVVPVVIGALGAIPKGLTKHLKTLGIDKISPAQLQKAALLGTAHILRKYL